MKTNEIRKIEMISYAEKLDKELASMVKEEKGNPSYFQDCVKSAMMLAFQE